MFSQLHGSTLDAFKVLKAKRVLPEPLVQPALPVPLVHKDLRAFKVSKVLLVLWV